MRQLKVRSDACHVRDLYEQEIKYCYPASYTEDSNDDHAYGPHDMFVYSKNPDGEEFWSQGDFYPSGGFIQNLDVTNASEAMNTVHMLKVRI